MLSKNIRFIKISLITLMAFMLFSSYTNKNNNLLNGPTIDPSRYQGIWYEIARNPAWFERNSAFVWVEYKLCSNSKNLPFLSIKNSSLNHDGSFHDITGKALITDPGSNCRLKVLLGFWPRLFTYFKKYNYGIYYVDAEYNIAIVGYGKYFWILAREPLSISKNMRQDLIIKGQSYGFATDKIICTDWSEKSLEKAKMKQLPPQDIK
ncbi:lipocalin family protein [Candidatus Clavichlamydia salmonicola]|uniref:lipocalin family protein n=1 Tax=Candidatus Clavichlamydia salmonicola TaxID=469812 RepID=UPI0018915C34|nr:lipocalin family protein [Candidatus Clavichlamydia salmonicola]